MLSKRIDRSTFCSKADDIIKCHSRGFLSGISAILKTQGGDPRLQTSGMTPFKVEPLNRGPYLFRPRPARSLCGVSSHFFRAPLRSGFTLIELLVVVLIIGILAAVALPQYQKAVKKSRGAEALTTMDALDQAITSYYFEHDTYNGIGKETLNIELPELQHFRYTIGSTGKYDAGNSQLQDTFFRYNSGALNGQSLSLNLANPDVVLYMLWERGKLRNAYCMPSNMSSCSDYFNCAIDTPRTSLVPGSTLYTGGNCYIKGGQY